MFRRSAALACLILLVMARALAPASLLAEDGSAAWLRYAPIPHTGLYRSVPSRIVVPGRSSQEQAAGLELQRGLSAMLGRPFTLVQTPPGAGPFLLLKLAGSLAPEAYRTTFPGERSSLIIEGGSPRAELYGAFHLLEQVASEQPIPVVEDDRPAIPVRWTDEWDNLDGSIERGYAGASIFFAGGHVRGDLTRAAAYARLLASVGINGCNVNNVNADLDLLTSDHLHELARIADAFRPWGVKLALSVDVASPVTVGHLSTFDPLDRKVIAWWKGKADEIYTLIPDFGGFTVKADSEGRKGPSQYGRTPADAANALANALAPHGGVVLYRGFVYNNHLDWHDPRADRARAGVDNFARYDGQFQPNVIIQIKEGPIDFQAREPVSPLFAALRRTNVALEVQASQEYTGQQRHMVWLPSMWHWVLDTDLRAEDRSTPVKSIVEGRSFPLADGKPRLGGMIAVTNVGLEANWLHHPMAMANLFGFGKLAWNPDQPLAGIIDSWTQLTWGNDAAVDQAIDRLQLASWQVYEGYSGPNGMGTLTNILGYHFGPGIDSAERNGWGQWFRGEADGIGMDRTSISTGTGYAGQYPPQLAARYESLATCPDDLLLFFHHVPYDFKLHSGQSLVQSVYDGHYASAQAAADYVPQWTALQSKIDPERYGQVLALFEFQAAHAVVWRDAINQWFFRMSKIPDVHQRVGHDPDRLEAEDMHAEGYLPTAITPAETASGGKAVVCRRPSGCTLSATLERPAGFYDIGVQYFDTWQGVSTFELLLNSQPVASWRAADTLPPAQFDPQLDGQDSTRFTAHHILLKPGEMLEIRGIPDLRDALHTRQPVTAEAGALTPGVPEQRDYREYAPVDYVEFIRLPQSQQARGASQTTEPTEKPL